MHPAFAYLLKMLLCSGILLGYYWVALRNERFHQWNRFYMLTAFFLSVTVPLLNIPLLVKAENQPVVNMVAALPWNQVVVKPVSYHFGWKEAGILSMALVSAAMLLHLLLSVMRIIRLYHRNQPTYFNEVSVVITEEQAAPFSFFKWLFWRCDIDPDSENGQRMLQHELTHISEKHSADKLFAELLLIVFWMNPFFWLMRRELFAIHEFLADQKAIARYDGAAFAAMILQAAHSSPTPALSNPFFTSHLKRRLLMITTSKNPKYSYLRRVSGLALMVATAAMLVVSIDQAYAQAKKPKAPPPPPKAAVAPAAPVAPPDGQWTTLPDSIRSAEVIDKKGVCYIKYKMKDGRTFTYELNQAKKKGYFIPPPPPPPPAPPAPVAPLTKKLNDITNANGTKPIYIYAGLQITEAQMNEISPNTIESINVLKGESATKIYGEKGKNGVIVITPKTQQAPVASNGPGEIVVVGYGTKKADGTPVVSSNNKGSINPKAIVYADGKRITQQEMNKISPYAIASVNVYKGDEAVKKFGADAADGVIEIFTKEKQQLIEKVFTQTEQRPEFPGGTDAWRRYLERNLDYPAEAQKKGTQGVVRVQFVVDTDGNISSVEALNNPGDGLAEEAVRIIKAGPKWVPALQNGHKVTARTTQAITFRLE